MIDELEFLLSAFSKANHTHCFLHVNNLVARTLVRQFDVPKKTKRTTLEDDEDDPDDEIHKLAEDIDLEEMQMREALLRNAGADEIGVDDITDGWVNEIAALTQAEHEVLQAHLRPVRLLLVKVNIIIRTYAMLTVTMLFLGPKTLFQNYQLNNTATPSMNGMSRGTETNI